MLRRERKGTHRPRTRPPAGPFAIRLRAGALAAMVGLIPAACAGQPIYPVVSPPAATAFRAPYEAVWNAALQSLGIVRPVLVDRAQGHIVTDQFTFDMPVQGGGMRGGGAFTPRRGIWAYMPPRRFVRGEGSGACIAAGKRRALPAGPTGRGGPPPLPNPPRGLSVSS